MIVVRETHTRAGVPQVGKDFFCHNKKLKQVSIYTIETRINTNLNDFYQLFSVLSVFIFLIRSGKRPRLDTSRIFCFHSPAGLPK